MPTIHQIILTTLLSAFIILGAMKTEIRYKIRDYFDILSNRTEKKQFKLVSDMLDCDYCLSFWLSLSIAITAFILTKDSSWLLTPFLAAPLIRFLL